MYIHIAIHMCIFLYIYLYIHRRILYMLKYYSLVNGVGDNKITCGRKWLKVYFKVKKML